MSETDTMKEIYKKPSVLEIPALGYGNVESKISREKQLESGELTLETERAASEIILSGECNVPVNDTDDGCIDGRTAVSVEYVDTMGALREALVAIEDKHERAKIAGGGYMTSLAMQLALHPPAEGIDNVLSGVVVALAEKGIYCGLHSGDHRSESTTDCGANDKFETILASGVRFSQEISSTTNALLDIVAVTFDETLQDKINDNWSMTADASHVFASSTGESRARTIFDTLGKIQNATNADRPLGVSKHLEKDHKEDFVIINYRRGETFSQATLRNLLRQRFPELEEHKLPQAFVVDVWRIVELADAQSNNDDERQLMIQAGISYQLATSATLTDGSQRVFIVT
ncbi:MAG TPA: hypothetical protein VNI82_00290 [Candidatus Nitrosotenuis sp.]|nr:hypothetical protein [Candidatus Nitrosotenuis sp.]